LHCFALFWNVREREEEVIGSEGSERSEESEREVGEKWEESEWEARGKWEESKRKVKWERSEREVREARKKLEADWSKTEEMEARQQRHKTERIFFYLFVNTCTRKDIHNKK
jgi:hypothetical protein